MICKNGLGMGTFAQSRRFPTERFLCLFYEWSSLGCLRHNYQRKPLTTKSKSSRGSVWERQSSTRHLLARQIREIQTDGSLPSIVGPMRHLDPSPLPEPPYTIKKQNDGKTGAHLAHPLRQIMRNMPHSAVVVTSSCKTEQNSQRYKGMTVSSFTTLTLTPSPIITFNIKAPSSTLEAIRESRQFLVHLLEGNKFGAMVADAFTRGEQEEKFANGGFNVFLGADAGPLEPPRLKGYGIVKVIKCELLDDDGEGGAGGGLVRVGDHVIVLGKVVDLFHGDAVKGEKDWYGLNYIHGSYISAGSKMKVKRKKETVSSGAIRGSGA